jgi:TonB family protein
LRLAPSFVLHLALLSSAALAGSASPGDPLKINVDWRLSVDAQGNVMSLEPIPNERVDRVPEIRERLEREIRGWRFIPGTIDGKPAASTTALKLFITVKPLDAENASLHIESAGTGGQLEHSVPPKYPHSAISNRITGLVVLRIDYDASGKVTTAVQDPDAPKPDQTLLAAAITAARQWTFAPELVDGHGVPGSVHTPFCYSLRFPNGSVKKESCEWTPPGKSAAIGEGEVAAVNPATKLATDVAGKTL